VWWYLADDILNKVCSGDVVYTVGMMLHRRSTLMDVKHIA